MCSDAFNVILCVSALFISVIDLSVNDFIIYKQKISITVPLTAEVKWLLKNFL